MLDFILVAVVEVSAGGAAAQEAALMVAMILEMEKCLMVTLICDSFCPAAPLIQEIEGLPVQAAAGDWMASLDQIPISGVKSKIATML
jgi:hypothetical protein